MKEIPVIIFGAGGVGRALLQQLVSGRQNLADRNRLAIRLVGLADSRSWWFEPAGMSDDDIAAVLAAKAARQPLPIGSRGEVAQAKRQQAKVEEAARRGRPSSVDMIREVQAAGIEQAVVVDVTAVEGMEPALDQALAAGYSIVLANKKALAGPWETAQRYYDNPHVRHESTVGGGQPVIATMRYLVDINDGVHEVSGQLSGTLGYICQKLDGGAAFSQAVAEAKGLGYTEPDPREDLGGEDVMRKLLILARMAGWPLEAADIEVESLYDASLAHLSVPEFMQAVVAMDGSIRDRVNGAGASGEVLRYVGTVSAEGGVVGLQPVAMESPLANLKYIRYQTDMYHDEPLLICGKGAGVEMTAGGVLGDIIALGREVNR